MERPLKTLYKALDGLLDKYKRDCTPEELQAVIEASGASQKDLEVLRLLLDQVKQAEVGNDVLHDLLADIKKKYIATELANVSFDFVEGRSSIDEIKQIYEKFDDIEEELEEIEFVTDDLETLYDETVKQPGLRWRLNSLNQMLGSLRPGDFGFVFARPETGKTTFLASEATQFASQTDRPILWFNNEEQGNKVMIRCYQAALGLPLHQLMGNRDEHKRKYLEITKGNLRLFDSANIFKRQVEDLCQRFKPSLVIFDQIDKIKGFDGDREDLRLGTIYQWARELAKTYCPVIGVCQADGTGEGQKWLTMSHVANAKCLYPETKILMYDGTYRKVRDIKVGEQVMGIDSTPRNVLDVTWGKSDMYYVRHTIGNDGYIVNDEHILSLIKDNNGKSEIVDIPIKDYLQIKCKKPYFGFRVPHELTRKYFSIDPYYLGLWLGDGKATAPEITTIEPEIKQYVKEYAYFLGCDYVEWQNGKDNPDLVQAKIKYKQGVKHPLIEKLKEKNLWDNKHIPEEYFLGDSYQRRLLLAGLIDTDGTLVKRNHEYYSFTNKNRDIAFGVKRLALSCGFYSTCCKRGDYYYVHISGNLNNIPCLVERKRSRYRPTKDVLRSSIKVNYSHYGEYCGILIDGDQRFIIENNIVTHNTSKQAEADFIIGIGKQHDPNYEYIRHINISKNKLSGDVDTIPELRHGRCDVIIEPEIARYKDVG